jgi:leader peptidase (prepilin peptidase) / N-methyltransferase
MMPYAGFTLFLGFALALVAIYDFRQMRVPDSLNVAIAVGGVGYWLVASPDFLSAQLLSGTAFGGSIWLLREAHARLTGRIGLGLGDVKLAAAGAIWLNPVLLPLFLFAASLSGLAYAAAQTLVQGGSLRHSRIPFAPFLSGSIFLCWLLERWP